MKEPWKKEITAEQSYALECHGLAVLELALMGLRDSWWLKFKDRYFHHGERAKRIKYLEQRRDDSWKIAMGEKCQN